MLNLFQDLPNPNKNNYLNKFTDSSSQLDEIKNELDQQINYFLTIYKSLLMKNSNDKDKSISNDLSLLISKYQAEFLQLFNNKTHDEMALAIEYENNNYPVLKNLILLLNDLYKQISKILNDKTNLTDKLIPLERVHRKYYKWVTKIHKTISKDQSASLHLKHLANQMIEELDQLEELSNTRSSTSSNPSSISRKGNIVRILVFLILLFNYKNFF